MVVITVDIFKDGGTIAIKTEKGTFFIDRRIRTETRNAIYNAYPNDPNAKNTEKMRKPLYMAMKQYVLGGGHLAHDWDFLKNVLDMLEG